MAGGVGVSGRGDRSSRVALLSRLLLQAYLLWLGHTQIHQAQAYSCASSAATETRACCWDSLLACCGQGVVTKHTHTGPCVAEGASCMKDLQPTCLSQGGVPHRQLVLAYVWQRACSPRQRHLCQISAHAGTPFRRRQEAPNTPSQQSTPSQQCTSGLAVYRTRITACSCRRTGQPFKCLSRGS